MGLVLKFFARDLKSPYDDFTSLTEILLNFPGSFLITVTFCAGTISANVSEKRKQIGHKKKLKDMWVRNRNRYTLRPLLSNKRYINKTSGEATKTEE